MVSNTLQDVARHARIKKLQGHGRKFDQEIGNQRNVDARIHVQHNPRTDVVDAQRGHKETQLCQKYQGDDIQISPVDTLVYHRLRKERQHHLYQAPDKHGQQQLAYHATIRHEITGKRKNASAVLPIFIFHLSPILPRFQHQSHTAPFIFGTSSNPTSLKFFSGIGKALRGRV